IRAFSTRFSAGESSLYVQYALLLDLGQLALVSKNLYHIFAVLAFPYMKSNPSLSLFNGQVRGPGKSCRNSRKPKLGSSSPVRSLEKRDFCGESTVREKKKKKKKKIGLPIKEI